MVHTKKQFLESKDVFVYFKRLARQSRKIRIAVAYLTQAGYDMIEPELARFLKTHKENKLEFIVGLSSYCITEPSSLKSLLALSKMFSNQIDIRYYYHEGFHPKLLIFEHETGAEILVGSSNLTWQGMSSNVEANLLTSETQSSALFKVVSRYFEKLMEHADIDMDSILNTYTKDYNRTKKRNDASFAGKDKKTSRTPLPPDYFGSQENIETVAKNCEAFWRSRPGQKGANGING